MTLFVRDQDARQYVNLARCQALRVAPSKQEPGKWAVLALFPGRTNVVGVADSEAEADVLAGKLAARANAAST